MYIRVPADYNLFQMTIVSTIFHRNFNPDDILQRKYDCAVLYLSCVDGITIMNSTFSDNNCTSVLAESSTFHLQGTVGFYRNTGYSDGALAFHCNMYCGFIMPGVFSMVLNPTPLCT